MAPPAGVAAACLPGTAARVPDRPRAGCRHSYPGWPCMANCGNTTGGSRTSRARSARCGRGPGTRSSSGGARCGRACTAPCPAGRPRCCRRTALRSRAGSRSGTHRQRGHARRPAAGPAGVAGHQGGGAESGGRPSRRAEDAESEGRPKPPASGRSGRGTGRAAGSRRGAVRPALIRPGAHPHERRRHAGAWAEPAHAPEPGQPTSTPPIDFLPRRSTMNRPCSRSSAVGT